VRPERSWHTASMTCVQRGGDPGEFCSGAHLSPSSTAGSPLSGTLRPGQIQCRSGPLPRRLAVDEDDLLLTSVRTVPTSSPATPTRRRPGSSHRGPSQARFPRETSCPGTPVRRVAPRVEAGRGVSSHQGSPTDADEDMQDAMAEEFQRLHDRRRRLASELTRTERRLKDVVAASDYFGGSDIGSANSTIVGGGGGAPMRPRPAPSAGGPFAGKKTHLVQNMSASRSKLFNQKAADSYNYLGPGSDGPPLGDIHPLWG